MKCRALAKLSGYQLGTINAWIQRGHVPGLEATQQGKRRQFSIDEAANIVALGLLVRLGLPATKAARLVLVQAESVTLDEVKLTIDWDAIRERCEAVEPKVADWEYLA